MQNKDINTFENGLVRLDNKSKQPKNTYSYALNAVTNDSIIDRSSRTNEKGFDEIVKLHNSEYIILGYEWLGDEEYVFFIKSKNDNSFNQIIYYNINTDDKKIIYDNIKLNFHNNHEITTTFRVDYKGDRLVYFVDGLNDDRVINVDNSITPTLDISLLSMTSNDHKASVSAEVNDTGGILKTGQYFIGVSLTDINGYTTSIGSLTNAISISDDKYLKNIPVTLNYNINNNVLSINGNKGDVVTNKSLSLTISDIDTNYSYVNIYIVQVLTTTTNIFSIKNIGIDGNSTINYEYKGTEGVLDTTVNINDILVNRITYYASEMINQKDNRLIRGNSIIKQDLINYQEIANNIKVRYKVSEELVNNSHQLVTQLDMLSKVQIDNLTTKHYSLSPEYLAKTGEANLEITKSFMRDEIYSLGIGFELNDGSETAVFHIPGRVMTDEYDTDFSGVGEYNKIYNKSGWDTGVTGTDWLTKNTAIKGSNELSYWRSDEVYPDGYGYPTNGEKLNGKSYVRHHKMPSDVLEPIYRTEVPSNMNSGDTCEYKLFKRNLSLDVYNINIPDEYKDLIVKIKIFYTPRTDLNKSIISKGLLYKTGIVDDKIRQSYGFNIFQDNTSESVNYQFVSPDVDFKFKQFPISGNRFKLCSINKGYVYYQGQAGNFFDDYLYLIKLANNYRIKNEDVREELVTGTCFYNQSALPTSINYDRDIEDIRFIDRNYSSGDTDFRGEQNTTLLKLNSGIAINPLDYPELQFPDPTKARVLYDKINYKADQTGNSQDHDITSAMYDSVIYGAIVNDNRSLYGRPLNLTYIDTGSYEINNSSFNGNIEVKNGDCFIDIHYTRKSYSINNTVPDYYVLRYFEGSTPTEFSWALPGTNTHEIKTDSYIAFVAETDLNIRMRRVGDNGNKETDYYFPISTIEDPTYTGYEAKSNSPEYYNIEEFYNQNSIKTYFANNIKLDEFNNNLRNRYLTRLVYSDKQNLEDKSDNYRILRANNYRDLPMDRGYITQSFIKQDKFYVITRDAVFDVYASNKALQTFDSDSITIGTGEFFGLEPVELIALKGGFGGTSSKFSLSESPYGYLFVDTLKNKVILFNNDLKDINIAGLNENFKMELYDQFPELKTSGFDNPSTGDGILSIYDPKLHRYIITKNDYKATNALLNKYKGLYDSSKIYNIGDIVSDEGNLKEVGIPTNIPFTESSNFSDWKIHNVPTFNYSIQYGVNPSTWNGLIFTRNGIEIDRIESPTSNNLNNIFSKGDVIGIRQFTYPNTFPWAPNSEARLVIKVNGSTVYDETVYSQATELQSYVINSTEDTNSIEISSVGNSTQPNWSSKILTTNNSLNTGDININIVDSTDGLFKLNLSPKFGIGSNYPFNTISDPSGHLEIKLKNNTNSSINYTLVGGSSYSSTGTIPANSEIEVTNVPKDSITLTT